jgi:CBS domain-containing protein
MGHVLKMASVPPTQVESDASVFEAVEAMARNRVGAIAVVDGGRLRGVFTERDLMLRVVAKRLDPESTPVGEVCTTKLITARPTMNGSEALRTMIERHIRHLPIVDERGLLVGMLSIRNLLQTRVEELTSQLQSLEAYLGADGCGG